MALSVLFVIPKSFIALIKALSPKAPPGEAVTEPPPPVAVEAAAASAAGVTLSPIAARSAFPSSSCANVS